MDELWQRYRTFWTPVLIGVGVFLAAWALGGIVAFVIRTAKGRFASATFDARRGIEIGVAGQNE